MIYTYIPYAPAEHNRNLGWAYNNFMERIGEEDWACFLDHDAMFTTRGWYAQLEAVIQKYEGIGCFTAMTNRIGNPMQIPDYDLDKMINAPDPRAYHQLLLEQELVNHDMVHHRRIGKRLAEEHYDTAVEMTTDFKMSGVLILLSKKLWRKIKFIDGFLGVDCQFHWDTTISGNPVFLMKGVYVYHWYRGDQDLSHLEGAE